TSLVATWSLFLLKDADCLVINLKNVSCTWNKKGTPKVNYTFYSRWKEKSCPQYLTENNMNIGCIQPCESGDRFMTFNTRLVHGKDRFEEKHELKKRVKLNPPTNLTVLNGSDFNLWFYWNHTSPARLHCVESEVRFRTNNNKWGFSKVSPEIQKYCINSPSGSSRYELQVRNRIDVFDWSEPVFWGSNSSIDSDSVPVWMTLLYVVGSITLILLVVMLLQRERWITDPTDVPRSQFRCAVRFCDRRLELEPAYDGNPNAHCVHDLKKCLHKIYFPQILWNLLRILSNHQN
uniref:Cytokine receptor-like factor 2-like D1 domain-containing protein n=1 Tax=Neolamprologus brichardi TaxID=32507 RepID=A0A3Q4MCB2_NEOBR